MNPVDLYFVGLGVFIAATAFVLRLEPVRTAREWWGSRTDSQKLSHRHRWRQMADHASELAVLTLVGWAALAGVGLWTPTAFEVAPYGVLDLNLVFGIAMTWVWVHEFALAFGPVMRGYGIGEEEEEAMARA